MTKKQIEQLVLQSYAGNELSAKKVEKLVSGISRGDLKMYIRTLKNWERKNNIELIVPDEKYQKNIKLDMIKRLFPKKQIKYSVDSSLITGVRVISEDMIYDFNLKNTLEDIVEHIRKQYD